MRPPHDADPPPVEPHKGAEAAGRVIGGGLGALLAFVLIALMLGPVMWAPAWAGSRAARGLAGPWQPWAAGLAAFAAVLFAQFVLLIQKAPLIRYPVVAILAFAWVGGLWLELTAPAHDWVTTAPPLRAPGPWGWALIGLGTVIYAGLYLLSLERFGKGRWTRRWQWIR